MAMEQYPKTKTTKPSQQATVVVLDDDEDEDVALPGFRFHPTEEELVAFYLKRKVEKKPIGFEIIKQIDIYKYDPSDLPKVGGSVGDKEWYFYCKRGRKYKNSVRPNRVTCSGGFWKATGIDRPIYDVLGVVVGLKKSLVYYRGSAGRGTKTDWMMHEFRLPSGSSDEAEIWTLCRILKRTRKHGPDWREQVSSKRAPFTTKNTSNTVSAQSNAAKEHYISFANPSSSTTPVQPQPRQQLNGHGIEHADCYSTNKPNCSSNVYHDSIGMGLDHQGRYVTELASEFSSPLNGSGSGYDQDQVDGANGFNYWDDLSSAVEFAMTGVYE